MSASDSGGQNSAVPYLQILAIVAASIGGYLTVDRSLTTSRPSGEVGISPGQDIAAQQPVAAKIWQDPLDAVLRAVEGHKDPKTGKLKADFEAAADTRCRNLVDDIGATEAGRRSLVMLCSIHSSPLPRHSEMRMRMRWSVAAALSKSGYVPVSGGKLGYLKLTQDESNRDIFVPFEKFTAQFGKNFVGSTSIGKGRASATRSKDKEEADAAPTEDVFVFWLPDDWPGVAPLRLAVDLHHQLNLTPSEKYAAYDVVLVGPSSSTVLPRLVEQVVGKNDEFTPGDWQRLKGLEIISPLSTIAPAFLEAISDLNPVASSGIENEFDRILRERGISFRRTIATDDIVAKVALRELHNRGINILQKAAPPAEAAKKPQSESPEMNVFDPEHSLDHIAVVAERDTVYGRALPLTYRMLSNKIELRSLTAETNTQLRKTYLNSRTTDINIPNHIHQFYYFTGIDGYIPNSGGKSAPDSKKSGAGSSNRSASDLVLEPYAHLEKSWGIDQSDYLRRLAQQVRKADEKNRATGGRGIRAILVLGSDIYDKLLVLRALRPEFPDTLFVTNNMNAGFLSALELPWTRNMVVVSPYGLELHDRYQSSVPPFRGSYQTSYYTAVLAATRRLDAEIYQLTPAHSKINDPGWLNFHGTSTAANEFNGDPRLHEEISDTGDNADETYMVHSQPRVFEIGRSGALHDFSPSPSPQPKKDQRLPDDKSPNTAPMLHPNTLHAVDKDGMQTLLRWMGVGIVVLLAALAVACAAVALQRIRNGKPLDTAPNRPSLAKILYVVVTSMDFLIVGIVTSLVLVPFGLYQIQSIFAGQEGGEPLGWKIGVSIWPGEGIRIAAIVTCFYFLFKCRLAPDIAKKYLPKSWIPSPGSTPPRHSLRLALLLFCILGTSSLGFLANMNRLPGLTPDFPRALLAPTTLNVLALLIFVAASMYLSIQCWRGYRLHKRLRTVFEKWPKWRNMNDENQKTVLHAFTLLAILVPASLLTLTLRIAGFEKYWYSIAVVTIPLLFAVVVMHYARLLNRRSSSETEVKVLWNDFLEQSKISHRIMRALPFVAAFTCTLIVFTEWRGGPIPPARGAFAFQADALISMTACVYLFLLAGFVLDAFVLDIWLARRLRDQKNTRWCKDDFSYLPAAMSNLNLSLLSKIQATRLLGDKSKAVTGFVYGPIIVAAILISSEVSLFDVWPVNWPAFSLGLTAIGVFSVANWKLFREANALRRDTMEDISHEMRKNLAVAASGKLGGSGTEADANANTSSTPNDPENGESVSKTQGDLGLKNKLLEQIEHEIHQQRTGAYASFFNQPLVRAMIFSSGGLGLGTIVSTLIQMHQ